MRKSIFAVVAVTLLGTGAALAQTIVIEPEQRTRIREYVVEQRVPPVRFRERVTVGAVLPADVDLVAVPETWGPSLRRYRYVYWDDRVVLVEPSSRRVIQIID